MSEPLHWMTGMRDPVLGHYSTLCGLTGMRYLGHQPMAPKSRDAIVHDGARVFISNEVPGITCAACRKVVSAARRKKHG